MPETLVRLPCIALLPLLALLVVAGGCGLPHFERPELAVVAVELKDARLTEQHFRVRISVTNPNDRELPVREIYCTLELGGEPFGTGHSGAAFTVPARGSAEFEMLLTTDLAAAFLKLLPRLADKSRPLGYRLAGRVETDLAFLRSIPFDQNGVLK